MDRQTKEPIPAPQMQSLADFCLARGVIVGRARSGAGGGSTIVLAPPLVITRPEIDRIVAVLDEAIAAMGRSLG